MDFGPVLLAVIVIIGVVVMVSVNRKPKAAPKKTNRRPHSTSLGRHDFAAQWQRIDGLMQQPGVESTRSAIFEADKLLDAALVQNGFRGETMGERLKNARDHFGGSNPVYQGLWEAHKMRNALAHELGFDLPKAVAQQHLAKFEAGLRYLRVL